MDILLVDDDETLRQSLALLLQSEGYKVTEAESGEEAVQAAQGHYFDLVLCDIRMPGIDGIEAIQQLREFVSESYVIVMTGFASEDAPIQALKLGVDDYLLKPFDLPLFLEKVRAVARRRSATEQSTKSLWRFVEALKDHHPALAQVCTEVEERCHQLGEDRKLSEREKELLSLGAWLHPLGTNPSSDSLSEERPEEFTEELASLLARYPAQADEDPLAQALAEAVGRSQESLQTSAPKSGTSPSSTVSSHRLEVSTFGGFELTVEGEMITKSAWQSSKARWLFLYLLSRGGQSVPESRLADLFWPGSTPAKAHRALVSTVHRARKALGDPDLIVRYDRSYGVARDCDYSLDIEQFKTDYKKATDLLFQGQAEQALERFRGMSQTYRGDFVPECRQDWCLRLREDLRLKMVDAFEKGAQLLLPSDPGQASEWCRSALRLEGTSEPAWDTLLRAHAKQGNRAQVEATFQECSRVLEEELNLKPGVKLVQTYQECLS